MKLAWLKPIRNIKAFTLVEVLMGMALLSVTLVAVTSLLITSIRANQANMNSLTGYFLAQEGLEAIRNIRDSNWLQNYAWNGGAVLWGTGFERNEANPTAARYFIIDLEETNLWSLEEIYEDEITGEKTTFFSDNEQKFTHQDTGTATAFSRYLKVEYLDSGDEAQILSVVFWQERGRERKVELQTKLSDWL